MIFWGEIKISSGLASILNATTPLWTVLLAHFLTQDERLNYSRLSGVALGIFGVVIIIGPDALKAFGSNVLAQIAVVGAAVSYAFAGMGFIALGLAAIDGRIKKFFVRGYPNKSRSILKIKILV